jgi:hypothetical protein
MRTARSSLSGRAGIVGASPDAMFMAMMALQKLRDQVSVQTGDSA